MRVAVGFLVGLAYLSACSHAASGSDAADVEDVSDVADVIDDSVEDAVAEATTPEDVAVDDVAVDDVTAKDNGSDELFEDAVPDGEGDGEGTDGEGTDGDVTDVGLAEADTADGADGAAGCGDHVCLGDEECGSCPEDCGQCPFPCGDETCDAESGEMCATCPADCGTCPACGDTTCDTGNGETPALCPRDCATPLPCDFDGICDVGTETCGNCEVDCGPCFGSCGDAVCNGLEDCAWCPGDCSCNPNCGNGLCESALGESCSACATDCGTCPMSCGDAVCDAAAGKDCDNCPSDCGACPPTLHFGGDGRLHLSAPIEQGRPLRITYDWTRLPDCRAMDGAVPGWMIEVYYTFDPAVPGTAVAMVDVTGEPSPNRPVIEVPSTAHDIWLWVRNFDVTKCERWDAHGGGTFLLPVFSATDLSSAVAAAGPAEFVRRTDSAVSSLGDADPAYFFAALTTTAGTWTWQQARMYAPGISDHPYQDAATIAVVLPLVTRAVSYTDAWGVGPAGQAKHAIPISGIGGNGSDFWYRWFPGATTLMGNPIVDGAYSYRFEFCALNSLSCYVLGGSGGGDRTVVLAQDENCALFPSHPPADICP